ncbi:MAG: hypothetical protein MK135_13545, partial [Polyangiaceae bacterium]|nr:hypothetical protein [Polyangiaceae bacterium]
RDALLKVDSSRLSFQYLNSTYLSFSDGPQPPQETKAEDLVTLEAPKDQDGFSRLIDELEALLEFCKRGQAQGAKAIRFRYG